MCNQPNQGTQTIKVQKEIARTKAFDGLNQCKYKKNIFVRKNSWNDEIVFILPGN